MKKNIVFSCTLRVRYCEVDQQGIVYNGHYGIYADYAFEEFLRSKGIAYGDLSNKLNFEVRHRKSTYEYFGSACADDLLEIDMKLVRLGTKSFTVGFDIRRQGEEEALVYAEVVFVGYDVENRTSQPIPPVLRELLGVTRDN